MLFLHSVYYLSQRDLCATPKSTSAVILSKKIFLTSKEGSLLFNLNLKDVVKFAHNYDFIKGKFENVAI